MNQNWQFSGRQLFTICCSAFMGGMSLMSSILWALYGESMDLILTSGLLFLSMLFASIKTVMGGKPKP